MRYAHQILQWLTKEKLFYPYMKKEIIGGRRGGGSHTTVLEQE